VKLFLVGANSPTGRALIEILRKNKIRFLAPADKSFDPVDGPAIAKLISDFAPTQLVNMADFISRNHSALKRAESSERRCERINALLPETLAEICNKLDIPMLHLSNVYVFDGEKKLGYNENDEPNPKGVYGRYSLVGEQAVRKHPSHIIIRSGWLFGKHKIGLIKSWIHSIKKHKGELTVWRRRFSPTSTTDMAAAILAVTRQVDCDANVWGTYHYSGLEIKKEIEFARQVLKYAANHDEEIYQMLENTKIRENLPRLPELPNSTLSSKKMFDTFGIKQKSWHGDLKDTIKTLYVGRLRTAIDEDSEADISE
jgi:dTDP-4-dehydrorhamnose reductase